MISVIIPAYNCVHYIKECLDSVLSQLYHDIEIIIVDDGSDDGTELIVERHSNDSRIRLIRQRNEGSSAARNAGLEVSTGEWISFIDADDLVDPRFYCDALKVASDVDCDVLMCGLYMGSELHYSYNHYYSNRDDILLGLLHRTIPCRVMNKLYRKNVIGEVRFNEGRNLYEDGPWSAKVLSRCNGLTCIPAGYYRYRYTPHSQSRKSFYTAEQLAVFWSNKIDRDILIYQNLKSQLNRISIKPKLREHYFEACALASKVNNELLETKIAEFSSLLY